MSNQPTTTDAAGATQPASTIECHENRISGKGVDYTTRAWYVRRDGKLHGQFHTEREAISFAAALDNPPAATSAEIAEALASGFMLLALKGALKLESHGMKRRGRSALSVARAQFPGIVTGRTAAAALPQLVAQLKSMGVLA
jgi:hypothetical protein